MLCSRFDPSDEFNSFRANKSSAGNGTVTAHTSPVRYQLTFYALLYPVGIAQDKAHLGSIRIACLDGCGHKSSYFEYLTGLIGN